MEGIGRGLTEVLFQQLPGGTKETLKKLSPSVRCLGACAECSSCAFSLHQPAPGTLLLAFPGNLLPPSSVRRCRENVRSLMKVIEN
jgi:hypothetical protein